MTLFKFEKVYGRVLIKLFVVEISFVLPPKNKNCFISLGQNCFVRTILTRYGIKAKRKNGELSCPFDLLLIPLVEIPQILENRFEGLTSNLRHEDKTDYWYNDKLNTSFMHDQHLTLEELQERYKKRAENFINISEKIDDLKYILICPKSKFSPEILNRIYENLKKYRKNKPVKLIATVISEKNTNNLEITSGLNPDIICRQYEIPIAVEDFFNIWHTNKFLRKASWVRDLHKKFIKDILNA